MFTTVHPRACGEREKVEDVKRDIRGSSPRVRGTRQPGRSCRVDRRFIPARAGNARRILRLLKPCAVHPRACGERVDRQYRSSAQLGSSPRVRGTRYHLHDLLRPARFIPARAGNASSQNAYPPRYSVHPRACGERRPSPALCTAVSGSSPRVRGTLSMRRRRKTASRFIPARAGNAVGWCRGSSPRPVHPRACGERRRIAPETASPVGSSPRVRGTRLRRHEDPAVRRFIPARAGNAPPSPRESSGDTVHPRACGERGSAFASS